MTRIQHAQDTDATTTNPWTFLRYTRLPHVASATALAICNWPITNIAPNVGIDPSWNAALQMSVIHHVAYGSRLIFTYGPLGFLATPGLWYRSLALASFVFVFVCVTAFCLTLMDILSRRVPLLVAIGITAVIVSFANAATPPDLLSLTVGLKACDLLLSKSPAVARWATGAAVLAGPLLLIKFSSGVSVTVTALLLAGAAAAQSHGVANRLRLVAGTGSATLVTTTCLWLVTGQALSGLPRWLKGSLSLSSGYVEMSYEELGRRPEYVVAAILIGLVFWLAYAAGASLRLRVLLLAQVCWIVYTETKHGFIRHDGHVRNFFLAMMALAIVLRPAARGRWGGAWTAFFALTALCVAGNQPLPLDLPTREYSTALMAARQGADILVPSRAARVQAQGRDAIRAQVPLDPEAVSLLRQGGVQVDPWELSAIWAYGLPFHPIPVIQPYTAYTSELDQLNADNLSGSDAPRFVLRGKYDTIDGRVTAWDSPGYQLAELCYYRLVRDLPRWQVLEHTANRCSPPRLTQTVRATSGRTIAIAPPDRVDEVIFATIDLPGDVRRSLMSFLLKAPSMTVTFNGSDTHRFVEHTAGQPHVLLVPAAAPEGPGVGGRLGVQQLALHGFRGTATILVYRMTLAASP